MARSGSNAEAPIVSFEARGFRNADEVNARKRVATVEIDVLATYENGWITECLLMPTWAKISGLKVVHADLAALTDINIGFRTHVEDSDPVQISAAMDNLLVDAYSADTAADVVVPTEILGTGKSVANMSDLLSKKLYELAGLTVDPGGLYALCVTWVDAAHSATGKFILQLEYQLGD